MSASMNGLLNFNFKSRRFSAGFGSRDYRTSQTGSRPGGAMGPRSTGGSFPNYNAPPPSHGKFPFFSVVAPV